MSLTIGVFVKSHAGLSDFGEEPAASDGHRKLEHHLLDAFPLLGRLVIALRLLWNVELDAQRRQLAPHLLVQPLRLRDRHRYFGFL